MSGTVGLRVEVPIACFRVPQAREYFESFSVPPPATVFGMLLSLVGEPWRARHAGARIALAMCSKPSRSVVLRTMRRFKKKELADPTNARPDFQQLLSDVRFAVWIAPGDTEGLGDDASQLRLCDRVGAALTAPERVDRFGALSLGESTHLVNDLTRLQPGESVAGDLLHPDPDGPLTLPIWPDHVGSAGTRWGRYRLVPFDGSEPPDSEFETITPLA